MGTRKRDNRVFSIRCAGIGNCKSYTATDSETDISIKLSFLYQLNGEMYWPINLEDVLNYDNFIISLKKRTNHVSYVQRVISIYNIKKKSERTVVHMQFVAWPSK